MDSIRGDAEGRHLHPAQPGLHGQRRERPWPAAPLLLAFILGALCVGLPMLAMQSTRSEALLQRSLGGAPCTDSFLQPLGANDGGLVSHVGPTVERSAGVSDAYGGGVALAPPRAALLSSSLSLPSLLLRHEYPSSMLAHPVTALVVYFPSPRAKHGLRQYQAWLANLLSYNTQPMVLATSRAAFPMLATIRHQQCIAEAGAEAPQWDADMANEYAKRLPSSCYPTYWILDYQDPLEVPINAALREQLLRQPELDPEFPKAAHSPFLYAVWAAKPWFLNLTASLNPFGSNYFLYVDGGYCRDASCRSPQLLDPQRVIDVFEGVDDRHTLGGGGARRGGNGAAQARAARTYARATGGARAMEQLCAQSHAAAEPQSAATPASSGPSSGAEVRCLFPPAQHPHPSKLPVASRRHKILFEQVAAVPRATRRACPRPVRHLLHPRATDLPRETRDFIAGGFILGSGPAVQWYAALYNHTLHAYARHGWFFGKDQLVQSFLVSVYPSSFLTLEAPHRAAGCGNPWFFLPRYLQPKWTRVRTCHKENYAPHKVAPMNDRCDRQEPQ